MSRLKLRQASQAQQTMNITIVEHGPLGLRMARALSRNHRVHLLRSQESAPNEPLAELDGAVTHVPALDLQAHPNGLIVTDAINTAFTFAEHIIITPPIEYGGRHKRYNAILCEATLLDALNYNTTASVAVQTLVPPGFCDRLARQFGVSPLVHAFLSPPAQTAARSSTDRGQLVLGGPGTTAADHAALLRQAFGDRFRDILVDRSVSETVALLAAQLDLTSPQAIRHVLEHAQQHSLNARVLIECLGLLRPLKGAADASAGATQPAPLGGQARRAL